MNSTKSERVKQLIEQGVTSLVESLEQGKSDQLVAYLTAMANFHHYSFRNIMLITMQFPDATRVAGFRTWLKLGRHVKHGEKGILIIAPMFVKKSREHANAETEQDVEKQLCFTAAHVFDVSQTEGEPLPEFARVEGDPSEFMPRLKHLIAEKGIALEYADNLGGPEGLSAGLKIIVLNTLTPANEFSVLVHELAHEMLHKDERRKDTCRTVRETEAEAVAFIVSRAVGLQTNSSASDYIQLYDGTPETLQASLDAIRTAASEIIEAITH